MDNDKKDILVKVIMIATTLAFIRLLLIKGEDMKTRIKVFIAGVLGGTTAYLITDMLELPIKVQIISVIIFSPFISTVFPLLENSAKRWVNKITKNNT